MVYLDYNATTPVDRRVYEAMKPYFEGQFGNPSNTYHLGSEARQAVSDSRRKAAQLIGAMSDEIYFTGCGSESNNTVMKGVACRYREKGRHIISSNVEHPSVVEPLHFLEQNGYEVTYLPVNAAGAVSVEMLKAAIRPDTILVSVMHSNNEVGTLQPVREIGAVCRSRGVLFHTDASQSIGKVPINVDDLKVDFLTMAGHKFYAPKGIGALYVRSGVSIEPLIHGAKQEYGVRAGTENVPYIVGLGEAAALAVKHLQYGDLYENKKYFYHRLNGIFGDRIRLNGDLENSLPNTLNVSFAGKGGADILEKASGLCASTGSACHSGQKTISPVLAAMGVAEEIAYGAIRFSIGRFTTKEELDQAITILKAAVQQVDGEIERK